MRKEHKLLLTRVDGEKTLFLTCRGKRVRIIANVIIDIRLLVSSNLTQHINSCHLETAQQFNKLDHP